MTTTAQSEVEAARERCLTGLRTLSSEITSAMVALAKNDVEQLETRLATQERLCDELLNSAGSAAVAADPSIEKARRDLADLNRVYSAILRRAERVLQIMSALHTRHGQPNLKSDG